MPAPVQTFQSPNFYDREIDQSGPSPQNPSGTPAGLIGTSDRGPAFVPVTLGNFDQFIATFGNLDPNCMAPYGANAFLANRSALTFMRVLGAGANSVETDIERTSETGRTLNAGFHLDGTPAINDAYGRHDHVVQFIVGQHAVQLSNEMYGQADFTDNDSFSTQNVNLVRGVVMMPAGARMMLASTTASLNPATIGALPDYVGADANGQFQLIISTSLGAAYFSDQNCVGCHIVTVSLDPDSANYVGKVLNTDVDDFYEMQHLYYSDFAVDAEMASVANLPVGVLSGSAHTSQNNPDSSFTNAPYNDNTSFRASFGAFDARYQTPATPSFISQPFGGTEYDLFTVEALDDGQYANNLYKISIVNLQASTDPSNPYGTFSVQVRSWTDTDVSPNVLEQFNNCSLDPMSDTYVAAVIGDRKVYYNFDATDPSERRIVASGKYQNNSQYVRVVMNDAVDTGNVPGTCLPFGFRGQQVLKTNDTLTDRGTSVARLAGTQLTSWAQGLTGSIVPPIPFRSKVTKGARFTTSFTPQWFGQPGSNEIALPLFYWGVKFERNDIPQDPNLETLPNALLNSLTQFQGIADLDVLVTGSGADQLNDNKFTLAKVAFSNNFLSVYETVAANDVPANGIYLTSSVDTSMREAAYIRNGKVDGSTYTIYDPVLGYNRMTFATLLSKGTPAQFNRFATYLKFTSFMAGGYDGTNFLDYDARRLDDQSTSFEDPGIATYGVGGAYEAYVPQGFAANQSGVGQSNNGVASYVAAINVMTDPLQVNHNILALPDIREPFITDYAGAAVKAYGLAYYVMDLENFDETGARIFYASTTANGTAARPDVDQTASGLNTRAIDNNYVGTYFPDVTINDPTNNRRIKVPASVAALGALSFNDRVGYPWFAPAGFNRAALDFVTNVQVRLTSADRDTLYDSRINPIATFPRQGFVIFGQKTLQVASSALDRVNVRRLLLEVKRIITSIALQLEFEQSDPDTWNKFVTAATLQLGLIQAQAGIEAFQVIMNETNNSAADISQNKLNGKIVVVPTRVIEFIAIDFIITNSGVQFTS